MSRPIDTDAKKALRKAEREKLERAFEWSIKAFAMDIPTPVKQFKALPHRGYIYDFGWPAPYLLLVEIQGGTWNAGAHGRGSGIERDYWKADEAVALGYRVMMFSSSMLRRDPRQCVELVKQALSVRG